MCGGAIYLIGALGVFWFRLPGGEIDRSKEIFRECSLEYDVAVACGRRQALHRIPLRLLDLETSIGAELRAWLVSDADLKQFPRAYCALLELALISLVERRVECIHAIIKRVGAACTYVLPPYVCARVRESANLEMLKRNAEFWRFCMVSWRQASLLDKLLCHRFAKEQLTTMSRVEKIRAVYQCDMGSEYEDSSDRRRIKAVWAASIPALKHLD